MRNVLRSLVAGAMFLSPLTSAQEKKPVSWGEKDLREVEKILFAEAANQPRVNRRLIAKLILNRVRNGRYGSTPYDVIHQRNAFTCTFDGSDLWHKANHPEKMNAYERRIWAQCQGDARIAFAQDAKRMPLGIPGEDEIIAYHDKSIKTPKDSYWNSLTNNYTNGRLLFFSPKA